MARKLSKASVSYRPAPLSVRRCGTCVMLRQSPTGGFVCTLVAGRINRLYVCDRWAAAETTILLVRGVD